MRQNYTHKFFAVLDCPKEEFIYTDLMPLGWTTASANDFSNSQALDLDTMENLMGASLSSACKLHEYVIEQN